MATFPTVLPAPNQSSYSYEVQSGVVQSPLTATPRQQRRTNDRLRVHELTYDFTRGQARLFRQWLASQVDNGYRPFDITLDGRTITGAKFVSKPRMTGLRSSMHYTYSFSIVERL